MSLEARSRPTLPSSAATSSPAARTGTCTCSDHPNDPLAKPTEVWIRDRGGFTCGWQVVQCAGRSERPASSGRGAACLVDLGLGVRVAEGKVTMSRISYKGLGAALVSFTVPFMMAGPVAAQPAANEVSAVELACLALGFDVNTCTFAVREGVYDVVEGDVNADLAGQGVDFTVDIGEGNDFVSD